MPLLVLERTGRVLVGVGRPAREQPGGVFLVVAPAGLIDRWAAYVEAAEGEPVTRAYPRDFWLLP